LIDAVSFKASPGDVRLYRKPQLVSVPIPQRVSSHDPALVEALLFAEFSGKCPQEVLLVGIVPKTTELGCGLTEEVRASVGNAICAVLDELDCLGAHPLTRPVAAVPSIWWQDKVVSKCAPGEAPDVPGYPG